MHSTPWDVHTLEVARRKRLDPQRVPEKASSQVNGYWKKLSADSDHPAFKLIPRPQN